MKLLTLVLMLTTSVCYADGASAFVTGFANALTWQMGGKPYEEPNTVNETTVYVRSQPASHFDAVNNYGTPAEMNFPSYYSCLQYVKDSYGAFSDCIYVR